MAKVVSELTTTRCCLKIYLFKMSTSTWWYHPACRSRIVKSTLESSTASAARNALNFLPTHHQWTINFIESCCMTLQLPQFKNYSHNSQLLPFNNLFSKSYKSTAVHTASKRLYSEDDISHLLQLDMTLSSVISRPITVFGTHHPPQN